MYRRELLALAPPLLLATGLRAQPSNRMDFRQLAAGRNEAILEPELPIIDAHHHLFDRPGLRYMLDDYLADAQAGHRVIASVYVETMAFSRPDGPEVLRPLGEIEFANGMGAVGASRTYGSCQVCAAIVGHIDLRLGDAVAQLLDTAMERAPERFRGVRQVTLQDSSPAPWRFIPTRPPAGVMNSSGFRPAFTHLVNRGLSFDAAVFHHQIPELMRVADAFPQATIILNHCGHVMAMGLDARARAEVFQQYRQLLFELAKRPNVYCKVGGLGMPFWGFRFEERQDAIGYVELATTWRPYVETCIEAFGARRCMMESNYPPDSRSAGFVPLWNALKHIVRNASAEDKAALFHGTAASVYRLDTAALMRANQRES
ncbi:amidohydrolase family protein [Pseudomonas syringae USA007]|uniref:Amidohydrolase family protein n=1 Tax=Pseudomonas syringae USA007 TaxID=1357288 RepID=A0AAU8M334_PSESX|nr:MULTISPECIES: amidohydrolase family protein [Pseudomonas syringae group]MCR8720868.1 amidohydrolase family protein [Pseudomonas syringae]